MSEEPKNALIVEDTITKEDIVSIRMAQAERGLKQAEADTRAKKSEANAALRKFSDDRLSKITEIGEHYFGEKIAPFISLTKELFDKDISPTYHVKTDKETDEYVGVSVSIDGKNITKALESADVVVLEQFDNQIAEQQDIIETAQAELIEIKRKEKMLPSLERQVKAALAAKVIEKHGGDVNTIVADLAGVTLPGISFDG